MKQDRIFKKEMWRGVELALPEKIVFFEVFWKFSPDEIDVLIKGIVPMNMEDKWVGYSAGDTFTLYDAWGGEFILKLCYDKSSGVVSKIGLSYSDPELEKVQSNLRAILTNYRKMGVNF